MTEIEPVQKDPLDLNLLVDRCKNLFLSPVTGGKAGEIKFYSVVNAAQDAVAELITKGHSSQEIAIRLIEQTSLTPISAGFSWEDFENWDAFWTRFSENILQLETEKAFPDYEQIEEQRDVWAHLF